MNNGRRLKIVPYFFLRHRLRTERGVVHVAFRRLLLEGWPTVYAWQLTGPRRRLPKSAFWTPSQQGVRDLRGDFSHAAVWARTRQATIVDLFIAGQALAAPKSWQTIIVQWKAGTRCSKIATPIVGTNHWRVLLSGLGVPSIMACENGKKSTTHAARHCTPDARAIRTGCAWHFCDRLFYSTVVFVRLRGGKPSSSSS